MRFRHMLSGNGPLFFIKAFFGLSAFRRGEEGFEKTLSEMKIIFKHFFFLLTFSFPFLQRSRVFV